MTSHARLSVRELLIIFVFWTALATLSAVNQVLDPRGFGPHFMSPAGGIAMAYVESASAAVGTRLQVDIRGDRVPARVVKLPFYQRAKS